MKKLTALFLSLAMVFSLAACGKKDPATSNPGSGSGSGSTSVSGDSDLVAAAKAEGSLVVYGSCEEEYLAAACHNFEKT